ncbi:malto-oligosyltrehalose trehalohydrolase [Nocardioides convexus]|uniref:malto-oligosyltrehalose trehalohydrolase n=1 Tax=Nocardioides convexus TaxID=2712224 RepID=UPI0024181F4A|nr:malto-oligosyltrehalose trehalohydrolase [Nocardioides convexus]
MAGGAPRPARCPTAPATATCWTTTRPRCPTLARGVSPTACTSLSATFDPSAHAWDDAAWTGRQLAGATIYESHVGTFTPEGTLDAVASRLEHLASLGVGFVESMPVNAFNGVHNWGYDGVLWSAVHEPYGGPAAYQRLVDACHRAGIGVIQDVVYNHLGPSGNYLPRFGPYLKDGRNTWGDLVNLDGPGSDEVRRLILDNALMWLRDFHVDGLRLDAVHALADDSEVHLLEEMAVEVAALSAHQNRPLTLIAESDLNDTRMVTPREGGGRGLDAQWSDDFHHAVHVALTGETTGYYADFAPLGALAKVLDRGFFHDGTWSSFRERDHGRPVDTEHMPAWRLVVCVQNHDQVGNRARGDRTAEHLSDERLLCGALLTLASPFTPMLFQGEEWAASTPFAFFTSHPEPEPGEGDRRGPARGVREDGLGPRRRPRPAGPGDLRAQPAGLVRVCPPAGTRGCSRATGGSRSLRRAHPEPDRPVVRPGHRRRGGPPAHPRSRPAQRARQPRRRAVGGRGGRACCSPPASR